MAGIGFELRKLLQRDTLAAPVAALGHAAVIAAGPWIFTILALVLISTLSGVQTMDPRLLEVGRNYGAHGTRLFRKVILPAALPSIFTGLRLGLGLALVTIVAVEFITAKSGLGHLVYRHRQMMSTVEMYGAFALVGALGLSLTRGLGALQRRMLTWQEESGTT